MAAYAASAGLEAQVFLPRDVKRTFADECALYGATTTLVNGLITDAGRIAAETGGPLGWYDVSTLKEPYRIEGKKQWPLSWQSSSNGIGRIDPLPDRRRNRAHRHVEGVRGD
jgi:threonine synthase